MSLSQSDNGLRAESGDKCPSGALPGRQLDFDGCLDDMLDSESFGSRNPFSDSTLDLFEIKSDPAARAYQSRVIIKRTQRLDDLLLALRAVNVNGASHASNDTRLG
jgi:hypothetical protein